MTTWIVIGAVVIAAVIAAAVFITAMRNKAIRENGVEADAVVSRVKETDNVDADGSYSGTTTTYYVTYRTPDGRQAEAKLASGKAFDNRIGKAWDADLREGSRVRIKYLPEKPNYAIRIG